LDVYLRFSCKCISFDAHLQLTLRVDARCRYAPVPEHVAQGCDGTGSGEWLIVSVLDAAAFSNARIFSQRSAQHYATILPEGRARHRLNIALNPSHHKTGTAARWLFSASVWWRRIRMLNTAE